MDLGLDALKRSKVANLERLARSLGVDVPTLPPGGYTLRLIRAVAYAIEADKRRAAAEERRAMDETEADKAAAEIGDVLGETAKRPRAQLRRMARLMGAAWMRETAEVARTSGEIRAKDGMLRTPGGTFFAVARARAEGAVERRQFYRCFFDRPRAARAPKPTPAPKAKPVRRVETRVPQAQSKPRRQVTVPEVYVARRVSR